MFILGFWIPGGEEGIFRGKEKMFLFIELFVLTLYLCLWCTWTSGTACYLFLYLCAFLSPSGDAPRNSIHYTAILAKSYLFKQLCRDVQGLMQILVLSSRIIHIASLLTFFCIIFNKGEGEIDTDTNFLF